MRAAAPCRWRTASSALPLGVLVAAALAYGLASYVAHLRQDLDRPLASRGFRHGTLTAPGVELVKKELAGPFDRKDTIVLVPSPEIALDLPTVRTIARTSDFESADQLKATTWHGRVGHIFVLLQTKMIAEGKAAIILGQFADYDPAAWSRVTIGDFTLFSQASR